MNKEDKGFELNVTETIEYTDRGFGIYTRFIDTYGQPVRIQESSSASENRVWIFCNETGIHLNKEQANKVVNALNKFIEQY